MGGGWSTCKGGGGGKSTKGEGSNRWGYQVGGYLGWGFVPWSHRQSLRNLERTEQHSCRTPRAFRYSRASGKWRRG